MRTKREADGGMRAVAVVGSTGKVGKEAVNVVERECSASDRLDTRREAEACMVCGGAGPLTVRRRRAPVGSARGLFG